METARISYLTDIHFGFGAVSDLDQVLAGLNTSRAMLVTDPPLVAAGIPAKLPLEPVCVYDQVRTNPTETAALAALELFRGHRCDMILAVGGGSPIDLAKAVALLVHHPTPLSQYAFIHDGIHRITADQPPVIAVPTTSGTGSEVGRAALITLQEGEKLALISPHLIPDAAICDPELTLSMPPHLTAATGMDAISHCIETFCSPKLNPVADAIALDGLARAFQHIRTAVEQPDDRAARSAMMMAALEGGLTFQKGLGAVHAMSHPLGALPHRPLHHGTLNAIFLPHVLRYNHDTCAEKMQIMAKRLQIGSGHRLPTVFAELIDDLGLPANLRGLGLTESDLANLPTRAVQDHCTVTNPRPVTADNYRDLFTAAL